MEYNIPKEIRDLKPVNTRVKKQGNSYLVIKRTSKRVNGKNVSVELGTIGHIKLIDGAWVYIEKSLVNLKNNPITTLEFGYTNLIDKVSSDILTELEVVYSKPDALKIYVLAILRVAYTNVSRDIKLNYKSDFISLVYPGIRLDDSHLSSYFEELDKRQHMIYNFMKNRINKGNSRYIIDGMLKTNDSYTNIHYLSILEKEVKKEVKIYHLFMHMISIQKNQ